jgi:hypothetical protein
VTIETIPEIHEMRIRRCAASEAANYEAYASVDAASVGRDIVADAGNPTLTYARIGHRLDRRWIAAPVEVPQLL